MVGRMGRFVIRAATFADAPTLAELTAAAMAERPQDTHHDVAQLPCPVLVAANRAGCVAGFASMIESGDVPVLVELYVGHEYRRQGAGSALLAAVVEAARVAGKAGVSLGVHPDNARARRLYRRHGFVAEGGALMALRFG
jgi:ribosomal protein S18 acetylase RimI-like enzyme